ncbi:MAG: tRNA (adenosine(37)-N6)-threonylcarbamoyltransferase complex ATPase subunit type 1 TsaE [Candidatus Omnitrophica bacterium]|nr:tRNA (adenosine(37)-N6)-threonylcarbamoyltransferase complex ATPase subunit type 1 TsaE [Candidatus Omnitrophota bacterium]
MEDAHIVSNSYSETLTLASKFSKLLKRGDIVCLFGDLGAGKTAFVKGIARGLKIRTDAVHSPTFTLMNIYEARIPLYHFDLYRISSCDLFDLGYEEFFYGKGVSAVEWSEKLGTLLPREHWKVEMKHLGSDKRDIRIGYHGAGAGKRTKKLDTLS